MKSALVHAAIVTEGISLTSDDLMAVGLVSKILGCQPGLEYSSTNSATKLYKAASSAVPDQNFAVCNYSVGQIIRNLIAFTVLESFLVDTKDLCRYISVWSKIGKC